MLSLGARVDRVIERRVNEGAVSRYLT